MIVHHKTGEPHTPFKTIAYRSQFAGSPASRPELGDRPSSEVQQAADMDAEINRLRKELVVLRLVRTLCPG